MIFGSVTIFGILSWYFVPEGKWLRREQVLQALHAGDEPLPPRGSRGRRASTPDADVVTEDSDKKTL